MADSMPLTPKSPMSNRSVSPRASQRTSRSSSRIPLAVFVFPGAAGHVNPTLPMVRRFQEIGWQVEYVCHGSFRSAIEDTGARFRDVNELSTPHGIPDMRDMVVQSLQEYQDPGAKMWATNFGSIATERLIPIFEEFFKQIGAKVLVYCPVLCPYAHLAATLLKLRSVSLLTAAGPGFWDAAFKLHGGSATQLAEQVGKNEANMKAVEKIRTMLGKPRMSLNTSEPLVQDYYSKLNLVSTLPSLADPLSEKDAGVYFGQGKKFEFVGPLLDLPPECPTSPDDVLTLFQDIEVAIAEGRPIVYVSMGTVLTGNHDEYGWNASSGTALTGKEMCQAVYGAVFKELGNHDGSVGTGPFVILSVGQQPDALSPTPTWLFPDGDVPENCHCLPRVPQVEVLQRARRALTFCVTHGGQNTFMECLTVASPMLVVPGFGDQLSNGQRVEALELGVRVDRPTGGDPSEALEAYHEAVRRAIQEMRSGTSRGTFRCKALALAEEVVYTGGVQRAVDLILESL